MSDLDFVLQRAQERLCNAPPEGLPPEEHNIPVVTICEMPDGTMVRLQNVVPFDTTPEQIRGIKLRQHTNLLFMRDLEIFKPSC